MNGQTKYRRHDGVPGRSIMNIRAAIFDVDGTLIRRNCTYLFMRYLFEQHIIDPSAFGAFLKKFHNTGPDNYAEVIAESLRFFSSTFPAMQPQSSSGGAKYHETGLSESSDNLQSHWEACFRKSVISDFNAEMVSRIRHLQSEKVEIILASGSYRELIRRIAGELGIPHENIVATSSPDMPCYGENKRRMVLDLLRMKDIPLSETVFFTDNISDIHLLSEVGEAFWKGDPQSYVEHGLSELGIINDRQAGVKKNDELSGTLLRYYTEHELLINKAIEEIFPLKCTRESMVYITGKIDYDWDVETLETNFFRPAHDYLGSKKTKLDCLAACLILEAGGIDLQKYLPLVAVCELLDTSAMMFTDIREWSREENFGAWHNARIENAVTGNVSIALLSMVAHNLIFNRLPVNQTQKLAIYESLTSAIFNALLGNGLKLYLEEQSGESRLSDFPEAGYHKIAVLINGGMFRFYFDLCDILQDIYDQPDRHHRELFIEHFSVARQLKRDFRNDPRIRLRRNDAVTALNGMQIDTGHKDLIRQYVNFILR